MSTNRPMIIHGENIIFNHRFKYTSNDKPATEIFDIRYFITKYGFFIPSNKSEFAVLDYLKNPTENNKIKMQPFVNMVYMVTIDGDVVALITGKKTNLKFFAQRICSGFGVKSIHNAEGSGMENPATILYGTDTYEEFIKIYDKVYDPHGHTTRMKLSEIVELLKQHGVEKNIETSDLLVSSEDFDGLD